jgi:hypothetical protein
MVDLVLSDPVAVVPTVALDMGVVINHASLVDGLKLVARASAVFETTWIDGKDTDRTSDRYGLKHGGSTRYASGTAGLARITATDRAFYVASVGGHCKVIVRTDAVQVEGPGQCDVNASALAKVVEGEVRDGRSDTMAMGLGKRPDRFTMYSQDASYHLVTRGSGEVKLNGRKRAREKGTGEWLVKELERMAKRAGGSVSWSEVGGYRVGVATVWRGDTVEPYPSPTTVVEVAIPTA